MKKTFVLALLLLTALLGVPRAFALSSGIMDVARPGYGCNCHSFFTGVDNPSPATTVLLLVDGEPLSEFGGYEPGRQDPYTLTVWVLGPIVPNAGFNLEATAGELEPVDGSVQAIVDTECTYMSRRVTGCFNRQCWVVPNEGCPVFDVTNPDCKKCPQNDEGNESLCRPCDDTTPVSTQATHTQRKPVPYFEMTWTPPAEPVEVEVFIVGNSVSGEGTTGFDLWNYVDPNPVNLSPAAP